MTVHVVIEGVYAAMRGTQVLRLFASRQGAERWVAEYNEQFNRGTRLEVAPLKVYP